MKNLLERKVLIELIRKIQDCNGTEKEQDELVEQVENGVLDPQISDYIFWSEMMAEEIVDKALSYQPIYL